MCQKCADVFMRHFGDLSDGEQRFVLWEKTAFPLADCKSFVRQVAALGGWRKRWPAPGR